MKEIAMRHANFHRDCLRIFIITAIIIHSFLVFPMEHVPASITDTDSGLFDQAPTNQAYDEQPPFRLNDDQLTDDEIPETYESLEVEDTLDQGNAFEKNMRGYSDQNSLMVNPMIFAYADIELVKKKQCALQKSSAKKARVGSKRRRSQYQEAHQCICKKSFDLNDDLLAHIPEHKHDDDLFHCTDCKYQTDIPAFFVRHFSKHTKELTLSVPQKRVVTPEKLADKRSQATYKEAHLCVCGKNFDTNHDLLEHIPEHKHSDELFYCTLCKYKNYLSSAFVRHFSKHTEELDLSRGKRANTPIKFL
jgi:hypothetical protein